MGCLPRARMNVGTELGKSDLGLKLIVAMVVVMVCGHLMRHVA